MTRPEAWDNLNPRETILFVGSGFSAEANNKSGENFLTGHALAERLKQALGYEDSESVPLEDIAGDFVPEKSALLYDILYPLMVAKNVSPEQMEVIKQPWRRIYTTNYDDISEFSLHEIGKEAESLSFYDPVRKPKTKPQVVHLHGYIHHRDKWNVDEKLVLTRNSYVRQQAVPQPWFGQFRNDIRYASAVVFVGYSLADIPINSLLLSGENIREKTVFITRGNHDQRYERQVSRYGAIRPIRLSGFAEHLRALSERPKPPASPNFSAFTEINPGRDKKAFDRPTTVEVRNLLVLGTFHQRAAAATFGEPRYVIPRQDKLDQAISSFGRAKTLLVHSRIGNGKSVFCELLNIALSQKGYRCIRARSDPRLTDNDLRLLKSTQRVVIFFRSLDDAIAGMEQINDPRPDIHFVVEISTGIAGVRANAVNQHLKMPFERIDLNHLTEDDKADFENILKLAGIRPRNFNATIARCREMRDVILKLYEDAQIRKILTEVARPLLNEPKLRRAMLESFVFKSLELTLSPNMARAMSLTDPTAALEAAGDDLQPNIADLFRLEDNTAEPWSAVVAEFLLQEMITPADITDWAFFVAMKAGEIKQQELEQDRLGYRFREAVTVLGKVLQVSNLKRLMAKFPDQDAHVRDMFERARHVDVINVEPLFWLQFSLLIGNDQASYTVLVQADEYLDTAYQRAETLENFRTYQLDTHALRLMFRMETHPDRPNGDFAMVDEMAHLLERFREMLGDGSHRSFVMRVLPMAKDFVDTRLQDIALGDRARLAGLLDECGNCIEALPLEIRLYDRGDEVVRSLRQAVHRLQSGPLA